MSRPAPVEPLRFFTDRTCGAVVVPEGLRAAGLEVVTIRDVYGEARSRVVEDVEWISYVAEHGLVALTNDLHISRNPLERMRVVEAGARLVAMGGNLTGARMVDLLVEHISRVEREARKHAPGIWRLSNEGLRRILP